jgi:hypothetical protein
MGIAPLLGHFRKRVGRDLEVVEVKMGVLGKVSLE